jgi:Anti-sigma-K factor rskA/Putative zinc-finger
MNENEHVIDHLPAYALGALDPDEETLTREHLKVCELCRSELEAYHSVSEKLVLAAPPYHPPEELREKILQAVSERDRSPRSVFNWEKFKFSFQVSPAAWVIMGILVLALAGSNLLLWREVNVLRSQANKIPFITIGMTGTDVAPLASGMIIINPSGQHGTLVVDGLPYLESTNEYQLWLIRNGLRTSGGTFSVNEQGYASIQIYAHDPLISYPGFGITIEPTGGSIAPTGDRVLGGEL